MLSYLHTAFAFSSLLLGAFVLLRVKGTRLHRYIGYCYSLSMYGLCLTSFGLFNLFGGFGIFHIAALVSLVSVTLGVGAAIFKKRLSKWIYWHYSCMSWSFLGLLGATLYEAYVHIPVMSALATENNRIPLISLITLFVMGGFYIEFRMKRMVSKFVRIENA